MSSAPVMPAEPAQGVVMAAKLAPIHLEPKPAAPQLLSSSAPVPAQPAAQATAAAAQAVTPAIVSSAAPAIVSSAATAEAVTALPAPSAAAAAAAAAANTNRPILNKEVKLEELSKYFHLPEKAVAKELGICLTSLKKLCRSYGITRWPFRKLKSLERTMKKVQTEAGTENGNGTENGGAGEGKPTGGNEVKRKPYTVGNKTVFLSDEELEVFKMTMGKEACSELKPTPITNLEPALFNSTTLAAASSALASAARATPAPAASSTSSAVKQENGQIDEDNPTISAEVKGKALVVTHWSTLWSQPQLKTKLLEPLRGVALRVSQDGVTAELEFGSDETAKRALRICRMAEIQVMQASAPGSHLLYQGQSILQGSSAGAGTSSAAGDAVMATSPPPSGSVHALLSDGCAVQPPSTHAAQSMWSSFLHGGAGNEGANAGLTNGKKEESNGHSADGPGPGASAPKSIGALGDSLPSPPMSSTTMGLLLDSGTAGPLSMGAPLTSLFPAMFQSGADAVTNGGGPSPPDSTGSNGLSSYLQDKDDLKDAKMDLAKSSSEDKDKAGGENGKVKGDAKA